MVTNKQIRLGLLFKLGRNEAVKGGIAALASPPILYLFYWHPGQRIIIKPLVGQTRASGLPKGVA